MDAVVAPVLHKKDIPPEAVRVAGPPIQITGVGQVMLHIGTGFTVTIVEHELLQPLASVTVTVYVVVTVGLTVMAAVVAPELHGEDAPPVSVLVDDPRAQ